MLGKIALERYLAKAICEELAGEKSCPESFLEEMLTVCSQELSLESLLASAMAGKIAFKRYLAKATCEEFVGKKQAHDHEDEEKNEKQDLLNYVL